MMGLPGGRSAVENIEGDLADMDDDTVELVYNDHQWSCDRVVVIDKWSFKASLANMYDIFRHHTRHR